MSLFFYIFTGAAVGVVNSSNNAASSLTSSEGPKHLTNEEPTSLGQFITMHNETKQANHVF